MLHNFFSPEVMLCLCKFIVRHWVVYCHVYTGAPKYFLESNGSQRLCKVELCCEYLSVRCIWLYGVIMSRTSFRVNPHSIVSLNVKERLAWSRRHIWNISDSNGIWTHKAWLWVRILLLSLKLQIWRLLQARSSLTFRQLIECGFTLKLVRDMIITYNQLCKGIGHAIVASLYCSASCRDALLYRY